MVKIPDCDRCLLYTHQIYFVCAVHPEGVETEKCPDFRPDPEAIEDKELWSPVGYSWYGDELIPDRLCRYTREEQEKILDTHPFFTGVCPDCQHIFTSSPTPRDIWQCPECGGWESDWHYATTATMPSLTISLNILKLTNLDNQLNLNMVILHQSTHTN